MHTLSPWKTKLFNHLILLSSWEATDILSHPTPKVAFHNQLEMRRLDPQCLPHYVVNIEHLVSRIASLLQVFECKDLIVKLS